MSELPAIISALTADGLALLMGQPPTSTLSALTGVGYQRWLTEKARISHEILFIELKKGARIASDVDPNSFFGLLHRYLHATKQGAARCNLRLMAQILRGSLEQDCPFTPDELAANADLVASLSRNEIKFLAVFWRSRAKALKTTSDYAAVELTMENAIREMIPQLFPTEDEFYAAAAAISRTGLIYGQNTWDRHYAVTARFLELVKLCDLDQVDND